MLMAVKNQIKISVLSIKYAIMKEMLNRTTFITNVLFMILNNASFIIQWIILYSIENNVGNYTFKQVLLLWGISAGAYGVAHFFFKRAFDLSEIINNGKLDSYLIQPKNVLLSCITTDVKTSALGDLIYGYVMLILYGFTLPRLLLYTFFIICGGLILTSISIVFCSLSFWFQKTDMLADRVNNMMIHFSNYPDGIFKGIVKILLYTIIPVGIVSYLPVQVLYEFNWLLLLIVIITTILWIILAFVTFYKGLKRYSSSNLMIARI